jgi:hypothetical protein
MRYPGGQFRRGVRMSADVDWDLPHLLASGHVPLTVWSHLYGVFPAVMESVDCWPLAIIPIQTLEGNTSFSNHPSGCDCSMVSLTFAVYGTASNRVSGVCVPTRGGPLAEVIRTRQLDAIRRDPGTSCDGDPDFRSHT